MRRKRFPVSLPVLGIPVFVDSYFPNDFGLYQMSGNVAEMTSSGVVLVGSFRTAEAYCKLREGTQYPFEKSKAQGDVGFMLVCAFRSRN